MDAATSVEISVYYESLCPDSIWYVCTKTFVFRPLTLAQSRSRSRREDFSSVRDPARSLSRPIHTPPQQPTPPKISGIVCSSGDFGTLAAHVVTIWWIWWGWRGHPTPYPQPPLIPPQPPLIPPILPPLPPHPLAGVWCVCPCVWCTLSVARSQKNFRPVHLKSSANLGKSSANFQKHQFHYALYIKNQI